MDIEFEYIQCLINKSFCNSIMKPTRIQHPISQTSTMSSSEIWAKITRFLPFILVCLICEILA